MKVFVAVYHENVACHCHPEYEYKTVLIVAEDEAAAKQQLVEKNTSIKLEDWSIDEFSAETPAYYVILES